MPQEHEINRRQQLMDARRKESREKAVRTIRKYNKERKGRAVKTLRRAKDIKKRLKPWNLLGLHAYVSFITDWTYAIALMFAVLKDILDPILISLSGFLTWTIVLAFFGGLLYAIVLVATIMASVIIWFMMLLTSIAEKKNNFVQKKIIRAYLVLVLATAVEIIPVLNIIPLETFAVIIIYIMALQDRKAADEADRANAEERAETQRIADQEALGRQEEIAERAQELQRLRAEEMQMIMADRAADDYPEEYSKAA